MVPGWLSPADLGERTFNPTDPPKLIESRNIVTYERVVATDDLTLILTVRSTFSLEESVSIVTDSPTV
jgi:hypothetical protein